MTFIESIQVCFKKYADFNGCASRPEFWWWALFVFLGSMALGIVSNTLSGLFALGTLVPYIAVGARRLHDTDKSGWLQLVGIVPIIGWILAIYWLAQPTKSPNRFGG
jgi:uncharacterized membrane protein YhaH (DUF805 family)